VRRLGARTIREELDVSTVNGSASIIVGTTHTRATKQAYWKSSPQANGRRGIDITVSSTIAKNSPTP
jgi:hypothetical protein